MTELDERKQVHQLRLKENKIKEILTIMQRHGITVDDIHVNRNLLKTDSHESGLSYHREQHRRRAATIKQLENARIAAEAKRIEEKEKKELRKLASKTEQATDSKSKLLAAFGVEE